MLKYQHKNFGKKLRHRAGSLVVKRKSGLPYFTQNPGETISDYFGGIFKWTLESHSCNGVYGIKVVDRYNRSYGKWFNYEMYRCSIDPEFASEVIARHRVKMVQKMAQEIIGVSPMTGPIGLISELRKKYG